MQVDLIDGQAERVALNGSDVEEERVSMKITGFKKRATGAPLRRRRRASRLAAKSIEPERPVRLWSLLLPPTLPSDRK
jgi:hypothetical protein